MSLESSTYKDRLRLMTDSLSEKAVGAQKNETVDPDIGGRALPRHPTQHGTGPPRDIG